MLFICFDCTEKRSISVCQPNGRRKNAFPIPAKLLLNKTLPCYITFSFKGNCYGEFLDNHVCFYLQIYVCFISTYSLNMFKPSMTVIGCLDCFKLCDVTTMLPFLCISPDSLL